MFQDFAGHEARLHFCIVSVSENNSGRCSEEGLWNISPFFPDSSRCMELWKQTNVSQHLNSPHLFLLMLQLIRAPKLPCPEEKDYVIQSDRFPCFFFVFFKMFYLSTQHFCPIFVCSQSSVSLDCIWNYRSSYHSLKRLVCPALCILVVLSNP